MKLADDYKIIQSLLTEQPVEEPGMAPLPQEIPVPGSAETAAPAPLSQAILAQAPAVLRAVADAMENPTVLAAIKKSSAEPTPPAGAPGA